MNIYTKIDPSISEPCTFTYIVTVPASKNGKVVISKDTCYAIREQMYAYMDRGKSYE